MLAAPVLMLNPAGPLADLANAIVDDGLGPRKITTSSSLLLFGHRLLCRACLISPKSALDSMFTACGPMPAADLRSTVLVQHLGSRGGGVYLGGYRAAHTLKLHG